MKRVLPLFIFPNKISLVFFSKLTIRCYEIPGVLLNTQNSKLLITETEVTSNGGVILHRTKQVLTVLYS